MALASSNCWFCCSSSEVDKATRARLCFTKTSSGNGRVAKWNGSAWICASDNDTTYSPSPTVSALDGSSSLGSSADYSRGDHKHGIGTGAITSTHILDGTILFADIGPNGCANDQIIKWNGTVWTCAADNAGPSPSATVSTLTGTGTSGTAAEYSRGDHAHGIGTGAITSTHILNGTILNEDIASTAAIDFSKLSGVASSTHNHDSTYVKLDQPGTISSAMIINGAVGPENVGFNYAGSGSKGGPAYGLDCAGCVTNGHLADHAVSADKIDKGPAGAGQALMYDGTNVIWGNPTSAPVSLPYFGTTSSSLPAFTITNTGSGRAGSFEITDSLNQSDTLTVLTSGTGSAGNFEIENSFNNNSAILVQTFGTGTAGYFVIDNSSNDRPALYAETDGTGSAGYFVTTNSSNNFPALAVYTYGTGDAAYFSGNVTVAGNLNATSLAGNGSGLTNVNADTLDGQHASAFIGGGQADSISTGMIQAGAVTDAKITGPISGSKLGPHNHSASDITSGTLGNARFSAYSNLTAEGYLDNNADNDLLTRSQADARYVNEGQANSVTSAMIGNGTILLANIAQNSCTTGQIMKWNGSAWACAADESTNSWNLLGNSGTNPATNFIGTTDNKPLELRTNNSRVLRIEPTAGTPNIIAGYLGNYVPAGVVGATIGGGGKSGNATWVTDDYGTVGGGFGNLA